jgi:hypothetical protein
MAYILSYLGALSILTPQMLILPISSPIRLVFRFSMESLLDYKYEHHQLGPTNKFQKNHLIGCGSIIERVIIVYKYTGKVIISNRRKWANKHHAQKKWLYFNRAIGRHCYYCCFDGYFDAGSSTSTGTGTHVGMFSQSATVGTYP